MVKRLKETQGKPTGLPAGALSTVFGHDSAVKALGRALAADELAGTYLFAGPQGVGKTTLAMAFGMAAACLSPATDPFDACGKCDSCLRAIAGAHPEIVLIPPAGDQTQIWQFWDRDGRPPGALQHTLIYAPAIGRRRVYIIERADTLNEAAANSLLKVLEEPPPYAIFVLLTPHTARMLPTVLSRSQAIRLTASPVDSLAEFVAQQTGIDRSKARVYAAYAEGRAGNALSLARNPGVESELRGILELVESIPSESPLAALRIGEGIRKLGSGMKAMTGNGAEPTMPEAAGAEDLSASGSSREGLGRRQLGILMDLFMVVFRDLLALGLGGDNASIVHAEDRSVLAEIAKTHPASRWMTALEDLLLARRRLDQNASTRLLTDWLALRLVVGR